MSDNTRLNPGVSGDLIASKDVAGVKHQRIIPQNVVGGTPTDVSDAAPLPFKITDGTTVALVDAVKAALRVSPFSDFMLEVSAGNIPTTAGVNKFGRNPSIASGTTEDVWDGSVNYTWPTTADITHLRQAIDQVAMRGASIEIQGLDTSWALVTQTKALDASDTTTPVALDTALRRVFRMRVLADVVGDQNIELRNVGGGTTYAIILAGNNRTLMAMYTVPAGKTAYMTNYYGDMVVVAGASPTSTDFQLWSADRANSYEFELRHAKATTKENVSAGHEPRPYFVFTEKTDIKMTANPSDAAVEAHAGFDLILLDN